jgi:hypothetical protein
MAYNTIGEPTDINAQLARLRATGAQDQIAKLRALQQQWMMPGAGMGPPIGAMNQPDPTPTLAKMMGAADAGQGPDVSANMFNRMQGAHQQGLMREKTQQPGPMPPPPTTPPLAAFAPPAGPSPGAVRTPMAPQGQQGLQPDMKAIVDAMTGKRVHKGLGGQQLGQEGVNPALKYMLYAMRGRRHLGTGGQEIY